MQTNFTLLDIATGGQTQKIWDNKQMTWPAFIELLKCPTVAKYTLEEFFKLPNTLPAGERGDSQDRVKSAAGGFIGGYLVEGKRGADFVKYRQIGAFDMDTVTIPPEYLWQDLTLQFNAAFFLLTTFKSTREKPRLRLVFPFSRPLTPDEYVRAMKGFSGDAGLTKYCDDSTYQPARMMYLPVIPKDGEYQFWQNPGDPLDPEPYLIATATDPVDADTAPADQGRQAVEDPLTKPGWIGAFNRAYTIPEAIEKFLVDVYSPTDEHDKYTLIAGEGAKGLFIYPGDTLCYSHHSNHDPASDGHAKNAFDLVRIHKFGPDPEDDPGRSTRLMQSFAADDPLCKDQFEQWWHLEPQPPDKQAQHEKIVKLVEAGRVPADMPIPPEDFFVRVAGVGMLERGNISAISGAAGSGKSTYLSILAAAILGAKIDFIEPGKGFGAQKVALLDTEQGLRHSVLMRTRIQALFKENTGEDLDLARLLLYNFTDNTPNENRACLTEIIRTERPDFCFIDGAIDFINDFNEVDQSKELVKQYKVLTREYGCAFCVVLHLSKTNGEMRGHLGTEIKNKSDCVLKISSAGPDHDKVYTVEQTKSRNLTIPEHKFKITDAGPELQTLPIKETLTGKEKRQLDVFDREENRFYNLMELGRKYRKMELVANYSNTFGGSTSTAKRRIEAAVCSKILIKTGDGTDRNALYQLFEHIPQEALNAFEP